MATSVRPLVVALATLQMPSASGYQAPSSAPIPHPSGAQSEKEDKDASLKQAQDLRALAKDLLRGQNEGALSKAERQLKDPARAVEFLATLLRRGEIPNEQEGGTIRSMPVDTEIRTVLVKLTERAGQSIVDAAIDIASTEQHGDVSHFAADVIHIALDQKVTAALSVAHAAARLNLGETVKPPTIHDGKKVDVLLACIPQDRVKDISGVLKDVLPKVPKSLQSQFLGYFLNLSPAGKSLDTYPETVSMVKELADVPVVEFHHHLLLNTLVSRSAKAATALLDRLNEPEPAGAAARQAVSQINEHEIEKYVAHHPESLSKLSRYLSQGQLYSCISSLPDIAQSNAPSQRTEALVRYAAGICELEVAQGELLKLAERNPELARAAAHNLTGGAVGANAQLPEPSNIETRETVRDLRRGFGYLLSAEVTAVERMQKLLPVARDARWDLHVRSAFQGLDEPAQAALAHRILADQARSYLIFGATDTFGTSNGGKRILIEAASNLGADAASYSILVKDPVLRQNLVDIGQAASLSKGLTGDPTKDAQLLASSTPEVLGRVLVKLGVDLSNQAAGRPLTVLPAATPPEIVRAIVSSALPRVLDRPESYEILLELGQSSPKAEVDRLVPLILAHPKRDALLEATIRGSGMSGEESLLFAQQLNSTVPTLSRHTSTILYGGALAKILPQFNVAFRPPDEDARAQVALTARKAAIMTSVPERVREEALRHATKLYADEVISEWSVNSIIPKDETRLVNALTATAGARLSTKDLLDLAATLKGPQSIHAIIQLACIGNIDVVYGTRDPADPAIPELARQSFEESLTSSKLSSINASLARQLHDELASRYAELNTYLKTPDSVRFTEQLSGQKRSEFFSDPALTLLSAAASGLAAVKNHSLPQKQSASIETALLVARAAYAAGYTRTTLSSKAAQEILGMLEASRKQVDGRNVFKDRNVLVLANAETIPEAVAAKDQQALTLHDARSFDLFCSPATLDLIQRETPRSLSLLRHDVSHVSSNKVKKECIAALINAAPPFTFAPLLHGSPEGLFIDRNPGTGHILTASIAGDSLTAEELATAYVERLQKHPSIYTEPDIWVIDACNVLPLMKDFAELVNERCKALSIKPSLPIAFIPSEQGESGFTTTGSPFVSDLYDAISKAKGSDPVKISTLRKATPKSENPCLVVPEDFAGGVRYLQIQ